MINKHLLERRSMKLIFLEHAISIKKIKKYDNFLSNIDDFKKNLNELNKMIKELRKEIKKLNYFDINIDFKKDNLWSYDCIFSIYANNIILKIRKFLTDNEQKSKKYFEIVYPEGYEINFFPNIEIEIENFNKIDISQTPLILRKIGVGKKCYKTMINKLGHISSESYHKDDRSEDAELVWSSIIKEKNIYSFICGEKIISFSDNYDVEKIINILKEHFKYELINTPNQIIMDNNFIKKYNINNL
jgi:hypothetical protein